MEQSLYFIAQRCLWPGQGSLLHCLLMNILPCRLVKMPHKTTPYQRLPTCARGGLVRNGVGSLAAAVHLLQDAKLPTSLIYALDRHAETGGVNKSSANAEDGYVLHLRILYFYD
ncbi:uncharacterized protein BO87DRAFT_243083 [Aspergillus neoniger CBS 115656]|uniref:Uncharacterized protein n=1 Tax=Aspergillus neoniger (strain CBS 115656) TaxID=1448310 RepID=A0A318Y5R1_ASPNB|nr:hypothetical protein BO87DRAFT_243083 [Aspergillus neoniger CBS 115656]PYH28160.1 hypothetical protein BO87DRAFT_243083 [Aspergillus neoniger CBS 115656]